MRKKILIFFSFLFIFSSLKLYADHKEKVDDVLENEIEKLSTTANLFFSEQKFEAFDSIYNICVEKALFANNEKLLMLIYWNYFSKKDLNFIQLSRAQEQAKDMLQIAEKKGDNLWLAQAYTAQALVALQNNNAKEALNKIEKVNYYVQFVDNDTLKIQHYLRWGKCLELNNKKLDAFRNYLNAQYLAQTKKNAVLQGECFDYLAKFYLLIGDYAKAQHSKLKQINLLNKHDSIPLMYEYADFARILYYKNDGVLATDLTQKIIAFGYRKNIPDLVSMAIARHRTFLIENGMLVELNKFYTKSYPKEFQTLFKEDTLTYYRTHALLSEVNNKMGEADSFYKLAALHLQKMPSVPSVLLANVYRRYAQFLIRIGKEKEAMQVYEKALSNAEKSQYMPYLVEISEILDSLYFKHHQIDKAYSYAEKNKLYILTQKENLKKDDLLNLEISNSAKQRELIEKQAKEQMHRRHNLQYMGIVISIISVFIILLMLGSFKVHRNIISALGFFSFIFLFEFIILLLDNKIIEITHHEPWKMMAFKIVIISFLLPFHHWVEHKVIHILLTKKLINPSKFSIKSMIAKLKKINKKAEVVEDH